jgi:uncharacterized coiled-coil protein SlyX
MPESDTANPKVVIRRTMDKLLGGACILVLTLVGVVWGSTWLQTRGEVRDVRDDVQRRADSQLKADEAQWQIIRGLNDGQQGIDRRVTTLEAQQSENARVFQRIEGSMRETDKKIDKLNDNINQVLREMRK